MDKEDTAVYQGTDFELVYAGEVCDPCPKWALGVVDTIGGRKFGHYASIGIVEEGEYNV